MTANHNERGHAEWSASATDRWLICPHSVDTELETAPVDAPAFWDPVPEDPGNFHTARGTRMHEEADAFLKEWIASGYQRFATHNRPLVFTNPANGEQHTLHPEEWKEHVLPFVNGVRDLYEEALASSFGEVDVLNEIRVDVHPPECWGSTDAAIIADGVLHVIDLKCGSKIVRANSGQNLTYACGLVRKLNKRKLTPAIRCAHLHIAQVGNGPHGWDTYTADVDELENHYQKVKNAIEASKRAKRLGTLPDEKCINSYCDWCPKFTVCPAHHNRALKALEEADSPKAVQSLPLDKVRKLVELAPLMRELLKAAENRLLELTEAGEETGYKVVEGRSNRRWREDADLEAIKATAAGLAEFTGEDFDIYDEPKLKSFTKFEAAFGKGCVDDFLEKPPGKPTLVPDGDGRKPLDNLEVLR